MEITETEKLRYPIGQFIEPEIVSETELQNYIYEIENFPRKLKDLVSDFSDEQLNSQYRPKGWTVRQVIHHVADSHMNAYIRFKIALTEDTPTIKPYYEDKWAELADSKELPVAVSLDLLDSLHRRWTVLLKSMNSKDFEKSFFHPEYGKEFTLYKAAGMYSWHGKHHYAHVEELMKRKGW